MFDRIAVYFLTEPVRLEDLGRILALFGAAIILAGLFGHVAVTALGAANSLAGQTHIVKSLADIYPSLPTWWIPEGLLGTLPAIFIIAAGIWLNATGKQLRRFLIL